MTLADFGYSVYTLWFYCSGNFKLFGFPIFRYWATWWRLFQKRVVHTKLDIYLFICSLLFHKTIQLDTINEARFLFMYIGLFCRLHATVTEDLKKDVFKLCLEYTWRTQGNNESLVQPHFVMSEIKLKDVLCVCFVDRCLSFCTFSFRHCVVCSSSIYGFWVPLWYLQTLLVLSLPKDNW